MQVLIKYITFSEQYNTEKKRESVSEKEKECGETACVCVCNPSRGGLGLAVRGRAVRGCCEQLQHTVTLRVSETEIRRVRGA